MVSSKTIMVQGVLLATIVLCMQSAIGQAPNKCRCYSNGRFNNPRRPCFTAGCSADASENCGSTSLFLYYVDNAQPADNPSQNARRFGSCSCPGSTYRSYSGNRNAYYTPNSNGNRRFYNITSCEEFGNIPVGNPLFPNAADAAGATACCRQCCYGGD